MKAIKIRHYPCSCCGRFASLNRWNTDKEGLTCLRCHIEELRKAINQIHEGIDLIGGALSDTNKIKFNQMNSQRKKLLYFQYLEAGMIRFKIK